MIPYNFDYYRPETVEEAWQTYDAADKAGKSPRYYGGGSEIISMARMHNVHTGAVIDLKSVPECNEFMFKGDKLTIGSCVTLSNITESKMFPLLGLACGRIADHTMQCRITIGGNVSGTIIYKESVLPLLLSDCRVLIAKRGVLKEIGINEVFDKHILLDNGDFIVQFIIDKEYIVLPYAHIKKTKNEKIDYPLVSLSAVVKDNRIRLAVSGVCPFPFRSSEIEDILNDTKRTREDRVNNILSHMPSAVLNDITGSENYRKFILKETLINVIQTFESAGSVVREAGENV